VVPLFFSVLPPEGFPDPTCLSLPVSPPVLHEKGHEEAQAHSRTKTKGTETKVPEKKKAQLPPQEKTKDIPNTRTKKTRTKKTNIGVPVGKEKKGDKDEVGVVDRVLEDEEDEDDPLLAGLLDEHPGAAVVDAVDEEAADAEGEEPADVLARLADLRAAPADEQLLSAFRRGHGACPPVTLVTGQDLLLACSLPPTGPAMATSTAWRGLAKETRECHTRLLRLLASMPPTFSALQVSAAVAEWLEAERIRRKWKYSTRLKYAASAQGALAALPLYRQGAIPIELGSCPVWRAAMRRAAALARTEIPAQPAPATKAQLVEACRQEESLPVKAAMVMAWAVAGRVGDILRLRTQDAQLAGVTLTVTYRQHKTLVARGPYSVATELSATEAEIVGRWRTARQEQGFLFPAPEKLGPMVRSALRRVDPHLEQRSLRRGRLLSMAEAGVPETVLLEYSGHTSTRMLRRYLRWGAALTAVRTATVAAGRQQA
jgi:integrase